MNTAMDRIKLREEKTNRVGDIVKSGNTFGLVTLIDEKRMIGYVIWQDGSCGEFSLYTHLHAPGWTTDVEGRLRELFTIFGRYMGEERPCPREEHE